MLQRLKQAVVWLQRLSPELPARMRRVDLAWKVRLPDGRLAILHIELQTEVEEGIGLRLAEYSLRLHIREKLPVHSVVIFFRPKATLPTSPFDWSWGEEEGRGYPFQIIRLWEFQPGQILETEHYTLWPLAGVMGKEITSDTFGEVAEQISQAPIAHPQIADLIGSLTAIGGLRLTKEEITEALRRHPMIEDLLRESSIKDVIFDYLHPEVKAEARATGLAEGRVEGEHKMARVALQGRFGALPDDLLAALNTADEATLEEIVARISTDSLEDVRKRLGLS